MQFLSDFLTEQGIQCFVDTLQCIALVYLGWSIKDLEDSQMVLIKAFEKGVRK